MYETRKLKNFCTFSSFNLFKVFLKQNLGQGVPWMRCSKKGNEECLPVSMIYRQTSQDSLSVREKDTNGKVTLKYFKR